VKIIRTIVELNEELNSLKRNKPDLIVGLVPTMGALHDGHAKLIQKSIQLCDIVVVSVFVNPTQFNNLDDLIKYPRNEDDDAVILNEVGCDIMFLPSVEEVYPDSQKTIKIDLNGLDNVMEGEFRPGHFDGVVTVVNRLFEMTNADKAFFGKKDYQQLAIVKRMVQVLEWNTEIVGLDIERSEKGLALSSRNARLSQEQLDDALIIYRCLQYGKEQFKTIKSALELTSKMKVFFNKGDLELEYLTIVDNQTLQIIDHVTENCSVCLAAFCDKVRLIDNLQFSDF
jgi:pantoate--beta-alanine ligase